MKSKSKMITVPAQERNLVESFRSIEILTCNASGDFITAFSPFSMERSRHVTMLHVLWTIYHLYE